MSNNKELLAWAMSQVAAAQSGEVYGTVTIYLEKGTITRTETKKQEKPTKSRIN